MFVDQAARGVQQFAAIKAALAHVVHPLHFHLAGFAAEFLRVGLGDGVLLEL